MAASDDCRHNNTKLLAKLEVLDLFDMGIDGIGFCIHSHYKARRAAGETEAREERESGGERASRDVV